jgi:hypothetical protein
MQGKIKKFITANLVIGFMPLAFAGGPAEPAHMPNAPMPKFNLFSASPSFLKQTSQRRNRHHLKHINYVTLYPGSLKSNIVRISRAYGWKHIIWTSGDDYHWIGKIRVAANNLPYILGKILKEYPLQADFYDGNHVLVIKPRTIQT